MAIPAAETEAIFAAVRSVRSADLPGDGRQETGDKTEGGPSSSLAPGSRLLSPGFEVWLYKGAWEEWEPHEVEMAVPVSPEVLERKKQAIFRHQSQKDRAMFPGGTDRREFWQRAEDRNIGTARTYDALGLPEYFPVPENGMLTLGGGSTFQQSLDVYGVSLEDVHAWAVAELEARGYDVQSPALGLIEFRGEGVGGRIDLTATKQMISLRVLMGSP